MHKIDVRDTMREFITERGYMQAAIAKKASITPAQLSATLNKKRKMEANEMIALCEALGIEPRDLLRNPAHAAMQAG